MQILFTRFPLESTKGGAENQTMWLAEGLRQRGHEVRFLGSCPVLLREFSAAGFRAEKLEIGQPPVTKWAALSFLWRRKSMQRALVSAAGTLKADVVFMLSLSEKILLTEQLHGQGKQVFWIEHDRIGNWLRRNPWLPALKVAAKKATIICVSALSKRLYADLGFDPQRIVAIPNGVPPPPPPPPPPSPGSGKGTFSTLRLGTVARLSPEKGIDVLLQAIAELPEVTLSIIGQGSQEGYLRSLIAEDTARLGIGVPRISIKNTVDDLLPWYRSLDAFVLPSSDHDPFGLVAAEAMLAGVPTIITDACGIAEYLRADTEALIATAGSSADLTGKIQRLLDSNVRRALAESGMHAIARRLTTEAMTESYEALFLVSQKTAQKNS